jgi:hypothetical protein
MARGTRRLLHDLVAFGRISEDRVPAWERLERELGPLVAKQLYPAAGGHPPAKAPTRPRRVA